MQTYIYDKLIEHVGKGGKHNLSSLKQIEDHIRDEVKNRPDEKRNWNTYEQINAERIRDAIKLPKHLIHEAVSAIYIDDSGTGRCFLCCGAYAW